MTRVVTSMIGLFVTGTAAVCVGIVADRSCGASVEGCPFMLIELIL